SAALQFWHLPDPCAHPLEVCSRGGREGSMTTRCACSKGTTLREDHSPHPPHKSNRIGRQSFHSGFLPSIVLQSERVPRCQIAPQITTKAPSTMFLLLAARASRTGTAAKALLNAMRRDLRRLGRRRVAPPAAKGPRRRGQLLGAPRRPLFVFVTGLAISA